MELQSVINALVGFGLPAIILFYVRDRRKNKAETLIAEATVPHQIDLSSISSVEAHVAFITRAFQAERESKDRQIADLQERLTMAVAEEGRIRAELERVRNELEILRAKVDELNTQINNLLEGNPT